jgi:hypothetical protein
MSQQPEVSQPAPPEVAPIVYNGVRYEQDMHSYDHGGDQPGGYLVAIDPVTNRRLWMLKVYEVADHSASGVDTIGVHFKSMSLIDAGGALEIENQVGGRYRVDLTNRAVTKISTPIAKQMPPIKIPT